MDEFPIAVRWARRKVRNELDYTKWHHSDDGFFTVCGLPVIMAVLTFFPETNEPERVNCRRCLTRLSKKETSKEA